MGEVWNDPWKDPKLPPKRLQIGEGCPDTHSEFIQAYNTQSTQSLQVDVWQTSTSTIYKVGACSRRNISYWHTVRSQKQSASKQTRPSQAHRLRAAQQQQRQQRQQQQKKQQLITNGEHLRVGCDGKRRPHMPWMPTDPDCKPTRFYMLKRKHKRFLSNSWQHVPQEITTKNTTNEWHFESFLYPILNGTTRIDAIPLGSFTPTNWLKTPKSIWLNDLMP